MSTFDGIIREFPEIRVDNFRGVAENPPLACFLSHIHSDHLAGLDTYKGRPVYCSAATRAMLLKLQKRSARLLFSEGVLEKKEITYGKQEKRLKPLPLNTPVDIPLLNPTNTLRVTLFDANHCPGAVSFLFEKESTAVLYTGDIRSEPWHVNSLARNPSLIPYTNGLKTLDKVYLDTRFTEDIHFRTKAEGICELLQKVAAYPSDTTFYFSAWTYGYEDVWIALARALNTKIHVDDYKLGVYKSLRVTIGDKEFLHLSPEAPALIGFTRGNDLIDGILTQDYSVRLHSCEKGTHCPRMKKGNVVFITPIVTHLSDENDLLDIGIGGGGGDLEQMEEELVISAEEAREMLEKVKDLKMDPDSKDSVSDLLLGIALGLRPGTIHFRSNGDEDDDESDQNLDVARAIKYIAMMANTARGKQPATTLQRRIRFSYSRHSSYQEACHLLQTLKPKDVWPCTVNHGRWKREGITIERLFGRYCSGEIFDHDAHMIQVARKLRLDSEQDVQSPASSTQGDDEPPSTWQEITEPGQEAHAIEENAASSQVTTQFQGAKRTHEEFIADLSHVPTRDPTPDHGSELDNDCGHLLGSQESAVSERDLEARKDAFNAVLGTSAWSGLLSTTNHHTHPEVELGESS